MPELPEVETIRNDLKKRILYIGIADIGILLARTVKNKRSDFKKILLKNKFTDIGRVGKLLILKLARGGGFLLVHLKMTGQLIYRNSGLVIAGGHSDRKAIRELPDKHTRVFLEFSDGGRLFFNDMRTFGYMKIVNAEELAAIKEKFGPEPLDRRFDGVFLKNLLNKRKMNIKALLLNQALVAGLGNIYADETLFIAGVDPARAADTLTDKETAKIVKAAKAVLRAGIKYRGTTFNSYVDADGHKGDFVRRLKVYGRAGEKCRRCGGAIRKKKVAGRGTSYCPVCQI
ncbi:DNA-formamidopyrimidine glycosylase [Candidatus Falkowbacteria bacterium RIFOXYB2_FULL_47_14]|uniref:Formamidopyrimidine-DNA glycosylase n=1 Tax=Candidatus Falkowbacteria bacterium RIFOXYA2_FULL_47_19 TaxID=1797994 RepID=A0A1F5SEI2_9BACT|nr:MAG: DNA-formamidopyrimidine glycosylase [Candidatus Falkowbacteria bacterium RIFOXYA2_FULL_47_19]OGF35222.1 MAG: DNA-formamidopyrimidine glycosylase [Candidatus Falkowbacteria bacterium RIFOXYC2_FULL_46_15]OGF43862.1 MAG: DNA-formamidopyrimidine glycosylase [Candidatus Falkowbacteria bacterium RIFOXYB2_FULL_47_14]